MPCLVDLAGQEDVDALKLEGLHVRLEDDAGREAGDEVATDTTKDTRGQGGWRVQDGLDTPTKYTVPPRPPGCQRGP